MSILNHPTISSRYFFPRANSLPNPYRVEASGVELRCHRTAGDPMLVHFHGNGEVVSDWVSLFPGAMSKHGIGCLLGEYRGYGGSSGRPELTPLLDDAVAIVDAADVPPERIVLYGRSVGSIYALHAAAQRPVAGLILESGIADVGDGLGVQPYEVDSTQAEIDAAVLEHFDHRAKIRDFGGPVLIYHTAPDHLVPVTDAYKLAEWAGEQATLRVFKDGGHNTIFAMHGTAIIEGTIEFVKACTKLE